MMTTTETHARHLDWWERVRTLQETQRSYWPTYQASASRSHDHVELLDDAPEVEYL